MSAQLRRIALLGGTFDPIHAGHLAAARAVLAGGHAHEVWFVPAGDPYHKAPARAEGRDRWLMTVLATLEEPAYRVARWDLEREGPSYTVDTLEDAKQELPDAELAWIVGTDAMASLHTWRRVDELLGLTRFLVVARAGFEEAALRDHLARTLPQAGPDAWAFVPMPAVNISSSALRETLATSGDAGEWLSPGVARYIERYGLYRQEALR